MSHYQRFKQMEEEDYDAYYDAKYGKFGSLGRKESMGRYRKYQPAKSTEPGIMGSPRLVHRNLKLQPHQTPVHQQGWPLKTGFIWLRRHCANKSLVVFFYR